MLPKMILPLNDVYPCVQQGGGTLLEYLFQKRFNAVRLGRGFAWLDTGTYKTLLNASQFVETIESRQGYKIACLEEIAFNQNWIEEKQIRDLANSLGENSYKDYLISLLYKK